MRWPGDEIPTPTTSGGLTPPGTGDGALLPVRGLSAARLGADDVVPLWERLDGTRLIAGVAGPGPSSAEATDPIRATRRAGRVLESLRARLENASAPVGESSQPGFVAVTVDTDDRDPLSVLGSEVQLAAAVLDRGDPSGGRVRLFWNGDARVFFLDAVALCRLTFEDAPSPGLPGPSAVWLRTVDVRPPTTGLIITCTHGAHGYFHAPWLLERALVASLERATSWRGFAEQVRFALERETKSGASFSAFPWGASDFGVLRQAILGPGGQRLSDLAARQASAGGAGWLNAWLSLYGPIHERWRFTLHSSVRALTESIERSTAPIAAPRPPPIDAPTAAVNVEFESDPPHADDAPPDYAQPVDPAAAGAAPANAADRPPNWGGVADALNRLSAEWARAARSDRPEPKADPKPKGAVVPLRVVSGGARREEPWAATALDNRRDGLGRALATTMLADLRSDDMAPPVTSEADPDVSIAAFGEAEPTDPTVDGLTAESFERADDAAFRELDAETLSSDAFVLVDLVESDLPPRHDDVPPLPDGATEPTRADASIPAAPRTPRTTSPQITSPLVSSPFSTSASRIRQAAASPSVLEAALPTASPEFEVPDVVDGTELIEARHDEVEADLGFPVEHESLEIVPNADDSMAVVLESPIFEAEPAPAPSQDESPQYRRWPLKIAALVGMASLVALFTFWPGAEDDLSSAQPVVESPVEPVPPALVVAAAIPPRREETVTRGVERRAPELVATSLTMATPQATPTDMPPPESALPITTARLGDAESPTRSRYDIEPIAHAPGLSPLFAAPPVLPAAAMVEPAPVADAAAVGGVALDEPAPEPVPPALPTLDSLEAEARVHLVLRRGPGVNFPRSGLLIPGTRVQATARKDGTNWVRVVVRGRPMWANFRRERLVPTTPGDFRQLATIP